MRASDRSRTACGTSGRSPWSGPVRRRDPDRPRRRSCEQWRLSSATTAGFISASIGSINGCDRHRRQARPRVVTVPDRGRGDGGCAWIHRWCEPTRSASTPVVTTPTEPRPHRRRDPSPCDRRPRSAPSAVAGRTVRTTALRLRPTPWAVLRPCRRCCSTRPRWCRCTPARSMRSWSAPRPAVDRGERRVDDSLVLGHQSSRLVDAARRGPELLREPPGRRRRRRTVRRCPCGRPCPGTPGAGRGARPDVAAAPGSRAMAWRGPGRASTPGRGTVRPGAGRRGHGRSVDVGGSALERIDGGNGQVGGRGDLRRDIARRAPGPRPRARGDGRASASARPSDSISRRRASSDAIRAWVVDATGDASAARSARSAVAVIGSAVRPADAGAASSVNRCAELGDLADLVAERWREAFRRGEVGLDRRPLGHQVLRVRSRSATRAVRPGTRCPRPRSPPRGGRSSATAPVSSVTGVHTVSATDRQSSGRPRSRAAWSSSRRRPIAFHSTNARAMASRSSAEPCELDPFVELDQSGAAVGPPGVEGREERVDLGDRGRGAGGGVVGRGRHGHPAVRRRDRAGPVRGHVEGVGQPRGVERGPTSVGAHAGRARR